MELDIYYIYCYHLLRIISNQLFIFSMMHKISIEVFARTIIIPNNNNK